MSRDLILEFWDPSISRERFEDKTFKTSKLKIDKNNKLKEKTDVQIQEILKLHMLKPKMKESFYYVHTNDTVIPLLDNTRDSNSVKVVLGGTTDCAPR